MVVKAIIRGLVSYVPGLSGLASGGFDHSASGRYCYSVWLRHLVMARRTGLAEHPAVVAELGPGSSLGVGLAALLSGSTRYFAFDVVRHASNRRNLNVLDELVALFARREPIPGPDEYPLAKPRLDDYEFPHDILPDGQLDEALAEPRIAATKEQLAASGGAMIDYRAPWFETDVIEKGTVDLICSQAVLEHVDDLPTSYQAMNEWLKPTGMVSHQIDFKCHGAAGVWNGHWSMPQWRWKLIRGRRKFFLNRQPHSTHIRLLAEHGFEVVCDVKIEESGGVRREDLTPQFAGISDEDLRISGAFILAGKSPPGPEAEGTFHSV